MKVWIRGAGDLASGIACRLYRCGFQILMTEIAVPTTVRRAAAFSPAVYGGETAVEGIKGVLCDGIPAAERAVAGGLVAVMADETGETAKLWKPDVLVDAVIAKRNLGTALTDAPIVIGVGPGFTAGVDCRRVVETKRGHRLGRCIYEGSAEPNTGIPGIIGGYGRERVFRAPCAGVFRGVRAIGDRVEAGEIVAYAGETPVRAEIGGILRGILQDGVSVTEGMKAGDVDPRDVRDNCYSVSDKALAVAGGVLEGILSCLAEDGR